MVVLPEMLVADWHLASSELGSSRIPTVWQDLAHSTTQICHTECATQWFATPGAAPAVSPETHTAQIWLTHCWRQVFESASWKLQYIKYHKPQDIYHKEIYALHPTTSRPTQQLQSCTTIMSSRGAIIGAHCHPPCPGASPIVHPFQRSQEISAGFCISQHSDWICGNCTADPSRLVSQ